MEREGDQQSKWHKQVTWVKNAQDIFSEMLIQ